MPFQHACFISYAHGEHELMQIFMRELTQELKNSLDPYLDITACIDRELLSPGDLFNIRLARAICQSVCMVVVYSPKYANHPYCLREYEAMRLVQKRRFEAIGDQVSPERGMIVPVIYRGRPDALPADIRNHIHYLDFSGFTSYSPRIRRNRQYVQGIEQLAQFVFELYELCLETGADLSDDCTAFALPDEQQVASWSQIRKPLPGRNGSG